MRNALIMSLQLIRRSTFSKNNHLLQTLQRRNTFCRTICRWYLIPMNVKVLSHVYIASLVKQYFSSGKKMASYEVMDWFNTNQSNIPTISVDHI